MTPGQQPIAGRIDTMPVVGAEVDAVADIRPQDWNWSRPVDHTTTILVFRFMPKLTA